MILLNLSHNWVNNELIRGSVLTAFYDLLKTLIKAIVYYSMQQIVRFCPNIRTVPDIRSITTIPLP